MQWRIVYAVATELPHCKPSGSGFRRITPRPDPSSEEPFLATEAGFRVWDLALLARGGAGKVLGVGYRHVP